MALPKLDAGANIVKLPGLVVDDPPQSGSRLEALDRLVADLERLLSLRAEHPAVPMTLFTRSWLGCVV